MERCDGLSEERGRAYLDHVHHVGPPFERDDLEDGDEGVCHVVERVDTVWVGGRPEAALPFVAFPPIAQPFRAVAAHAECRRSLNPS